MSGNAPQVYWERGRPARHVSAAQILEGHDFSRFALIAGEDARAPSKSLSGHIQWGRLENASEVSLKFY